MENTLNDNEYIMGSDIDSDVVVNLDDYATSYSLNSEGSLYGYYVVIGSDKVYLPKDKISYVSKTSNDDLINLSSSTITCYALTDSGTVGSQYRLTSFGTMQKYTYYQNQYNSWWQWDNVVAKAENSNITFGGSGIDSIGDFLLACIVMLLAIGLIVRKKA